ncbi:hypothetical protein RND81_10G113400 [Saponaria officinalis]|uniref:Uncharacterized protein n=1 Tax=Saponaria officinalis TaxID=3572 RepID=A0AAW1I0M3_SAPOF
MTQKSKMFKGQQKKKIAAASNHGKNAHIRKGKRAIKPSKITKDMDANREITKFINNCNEMKAATVACKEGGHLSIVKTSQASSGGAKK